MKNLDYNIIKWIQENLQNSIFDGFFKFFTNLADVYAFIFLAVIFYWVIDKRFAYKFLFAFIGSAITNALAKVMFKRPRPFDHPNGQIQSIGTKTHGYSFPSGHAQASGVIYYSLMDKYAKRSKIIKIVLAVYVFLILLSRMYLGQHYLTDVLVGLIIAIIISNLMFKLFDLMKDKEHIYPLYAIPVILIIMIIFNNADYDKFKDLFVAAGGFIGFAVAYALEKVYVKHNVSTTILNKILKVVIGLIGLALIYFGLKAIFPSNILLFDGLRYLMVALWAGVGAPFIFTKIFKQS